jgi:hypothetical protein
MSFFTPSRPALRAAACGGRPRAGNHTTATGEPVSPITPGKRWPNRARADLTLLVDPGQSEPSTRTRRWFCEPGPVPTGMQR